MVISNGGMDEENFGVDLCRLTFVLKMLESARDDGDDGWLESDTDRTLQISHRTLHNFALFEHENIYYFVALLMNIVIYLNIGMEQFMTLRSEIQFKIHFKRRNMTRVSTSRIDRPNELTVYKNWLLITLFNSFKTYYPPNPSHFSGFSWFFTKLHQRLMRQM